jgi:hypothetical protein
MKSPFPRLYSPSIWSCRSSGTTRPCCRARRKKSQVVPAPPSGKPRGPTSRGGERGGDGWDHIHRLDLQAP